MSEESHTEVDAGRVVLGTALGRVVEPRTSGRSAPRPVHFRNPNRILTARMEDEVRPVLEEAAARACEGGYVAGFVSYQGGRAFDAATTSKQPDLPLAWFAVFGGPSPAPDESGGFIVSDPRFSLNRETYADIITRIRSEIYEGNVYQINFTAPLDFDFQGDPIALFRRLTERQPIPFGAYVDIGDAQILSCSPELFFEQDGDRVTTRPMKGTARRGSGREEDDAIAAWLASDEKSRAENLMIVDLLRNDLSRCCVPGSVNVPALFKTERYETLIQMTSEVRGRLRPGLGTADLFASLFPCGSVTGAPKIRAMQVIDELESNPRGVYCGAVGVMHGERSAFNVAIRTVVIRDGRGRLGIGSGIVWDSDPDAEYEECLLKARFLTDLCVGPDLLLIETMRAEDGRVALLEYHVDRIRGSAGALGFSFDENTFRRRVALAAAAATNGKIRATLAADGTLDVSTSRIPARKSACTALMSDRRIDASDPFRRHKTTDRDLYEHAYARAVEMGFDEVIFLNEYGRVAEGSRSNVVAVFGDLWVTPPVEAGALPGVYRRFLLESKAGMQERDLTIDDLQTADGVFLCNAVWGLVPAHFVLAPEKIRNDVT